MQPSAEGSHPKCAVGRFGKAPDVWIRQRWVRLLIDQPKLGAVGIEFYETLRVFVEPDYAIAEVVERIHRRGVGWVGIPVAHPVEGFGGWVIAQHAPVHRWQINLTVCVFSKVKNFAEGFALPHTNGFILICLRVEMNKAAGMAEVEGAVAGNQKIVEHQRWPQPVLPVFTEIAGGFSGEGVERNQPVVGMNPEPPAPVEGRAVLRNVVIECKRKLIENDPFAVLCRIEADNSLVSRPIPNVCVGCQKRRSRIANGSFSFVGQPVGGKAVGLAVIVVQGFLGANPEVAGWRFDNPVHIQARERGGIGR